MPDNTRLNPGVSGDLIASMDSSGVKFQRIIPQTLVAGVPTDVADAAPLPFKITDGTTIVGVDTIHHALNGIDTFHHEIHNGMAFQAKHRFDAIANDASKEIIIKSDSAKDLHIKISVAAETKCHVFLFEDTVTTNDGTAVPAVSMNRQVVGTPVGVVTREPTLTSDGTSLDGNGQLIPAGTARTVGVSNSERSEIVLARDKKYMLRVTCKSGAAAADFGVEMEWYEAT